MKIVFWITFILAVSCVTSTQVLKGKNSDEILNHLQSNNYNIYILYFVDPKAGDNKTKEANQDIESKLGGVLSENQEIFYSKIDYTSADFSKLSSVVGVTETPAVLLIVHGKGVWVSGRNSDLMTERIRDFLPAFKQASAHHSNPY